MFPSCSRLALIPNFDEFFADYPDRIGRRCALPAYRHRTSERMVSSRGLSQPKATRQAVSLS